MSWGELHRPRQLGLPLEDGRPVQAPLPAEPFVDAPAPATAGAGVPPTTCPHCGGPLERSVALVNFGGRRGCQRVELPPFCPSPACREARDGRALRRAIDAGVVDP